MSIYDTSAQSCQSPIMRGAGSRRAGPLEIAAQPALPPAGDALGILTWNLGYGALGRESDFIADGGQHLLAPSRALVRKNLAAIARFLEDHPADIALLQELARAGPPNLWNDVLRCADRSLAGTARAFYADTRTRLLPPPLRLVHGLGVYARRCVARFEVVPLPLESKNHLPGITRKYAAAAAHLPIADTAARWTIVNLHLAAFDEGAKVRRAQARAALEFAKSEYAAGAHVVLGGDWNMRLSARAFPSTTEAKYLFWVHDLPAGLVPEGWRIAVDESVSSVRTNERPFRRGENYTAVIDGFIVSPNVEVMEVRGFDLGFEASDHQPVMLRARAQL